MLRLDEETRALRDKAARAFRAIKTRCNNPANPAYRNYGARGITVAPEWAHLKDFIADMGLPPSLAHSIDRIDNDGNYEPGNCRWATAKDQARNRRDTVKITYRCRAMSMREFCELTGVSYDFAIRCKKADAKSILTEYARREYKKSWYSRAHFFVDRP